MFTGSYLDWNQKKIKAIVDHYGHPYFVQKRVLDLGCGHGDMGGVLHRLGSEVTAVDARQDHLKIVGKKYAGVKTIRADLDAPWPFYGKTFDLILDLGLLCYLQDFENHLKVVCASCTYLVLETAVLDSDDPFGVIVRPDKQNTYDGSFNGFNSQVTAANIERVLKQYGMSFKRINNAKLNSGPYVYDWQVANTGVYDNNKRRMWFCVNEVTDSQMVQVAHNAPTSISVPHHTGVFSQHLVDSKIPITYQQVVTSRSPAPPSVYKQIVNAANIANPTTLQRFEPNGGTMFRAPGAPKMRLFFNYYEDKHPMRHQEIEQCLQKNLNNPMFDLIIVESESNPTFDFLFQKVNRLAGEYDISIICNSDIFFDNTIRLASKINPKEVYALTRWDNLQNHFATLSSNNKQNAWIVMGKIENVKGDFKMGLPGSDGKIAYEFQQAGYKVINPARSIKTFHNHQSGVRHYTESDRIGNTNQYLYVDPTELK